MLPEDFKVEVTKDWMYYFGHANYMVWWPLQATPYRSMHPTNSTDEAVDDAIDWAKLFANGHPGDVVFWKKNDRYYDSKGNIVSIEEIREKFREM